MKNIAKRVLCILFFTIKCLVNRIKILCSLKIYMFQTKIHLWDFIGFNKSIKLFTF